MDTLRYYIIRDISILMVLIRVPSSSIMTGIERYSTLGLST